MTPDEARAVLGLGPDATLADAVRRHRRLQRRHHPDVAGVGDEGATARSAELNRALAVLRAAGSGHATPPVPTSAGETVASAVGDPGREPVAVVSDGDSLFVPAPPDETWLRLLEAGTGLGGIGHVDPRLGLLELIVRFEGGPSCSVLLTLQGRTDGTEILCEMESIEAAPTPPITPVVTALAEALGPVTLHPPPGPPQ